MNSVTKKEEKIRKLKLVEHDRESNPETSDYQSETVTTRLCH